MKRLAASGLIAVMALGLILFGVGDRSDHFGIFNSDGYTESVLQQYSSGGGRVTGTSGSLTGFGYLVSIPVRIVVGVYAPFPWTSRETFQSQVGFNGSVALLTTHIAKSLAATMSLLAFALGALLLGQLSGTRRHQLLHLWVLGGALVMAASLSPTGFNRYVMLSYPSVWLTIFFLKENIGKAQFVRIMQRSVAVVLIGTIALLFLY